MQFDVLFNSFSKVQLYLIDSDIDAISEGLSGVRVKARIGIWRVWCSIGPTKGASATSDIRRKLNTYIDTSVLIHFPSTHHSVVIKDSSISSNESKHLKATICFSYLRAKLECHMATMVGININDSWDYLSKKKENVSITLRIYIVNDKNLLGQLWKLPLWFLYRIVRLAEHAFLPNGLHSDRKWSTANLAVHVHIQFRCHSTKTVVVRQNWDHGKSMFLLAENGRDREVVRVKRMPIPVIKE